jgi:hypothetical protein
MNRPTLTATLLPGIDLRLVYRKTVSGEQEILARSQGLSVGARRVMILIDGKRALSELPAFARQGDLPHLITELESKGLIALAGIADTPSPQELEQRRQQENHQLNSIKGKLQGRFEAVLGADGIVLDARIADCVSLDVFKRILREAITTLQGKGKDQAATELISLARTNLQGS